VIFVQLGERAFEGELATRNLQALDELAGAHEQYAPSVLDDNLVTPTIGRAVRFSSVAGFYGADGASIMG
jgi:hypothetical protein